MTNAERPFARHVLLCSKYPLDYCDRLFRPSINGTFCYVRMHPYGHVSWSFKIVQREQVGYLNASSWFMQTRDLWPHILSFRAIMAGRLTIYPLGVWHTQAHAWIWPWSWPYDHGLVTMHHLQLDNVWWDHQSQLWTQSAYQDYSHSWSV